MEFTCALGGGEAHQAHIWRGGVTRDAAGIRSVKRGHSEPPSALSRACEAPRATKEDSR